MSYFAYDVQIYPTKFQRELINKTFGCNRQMWNVMLSERKEVYAKYKGRMTMMI